MKLKRIPAPEQWQNLPYHPLSEAIDFGVGIDLEAMTNHMARHGYDPNEPIVIMDGKILDGRHRHTAARRAEVVPSFAEFTGIDPVAYVQKKIVRQHLDSSQRAMLASKLLSMSEYAGKTEKLASQLNVSPRTIDFATIVTKKGSPALQRAVRTGQVSVSDAASVAKLPQIIQSQAVQKVIDGEASTLAEATEKRVRPKPIDEANAHLPKSVANALSDTWHLEAAKTCNRLYKEAMSVVSWSVYLDASLFDHLKAAEELLIAAAPGKPCPICKGKKCGKCRQSGYTTTHA